MSDIKASLFSNVLEVEELIYPELEATDKTMDTMLFFFFNEDLHLEGRQTYHFTLDIRLSSCNLIILGKPLSCWEWAFKLLHIQNFKSMKWNALEIVIPKKTVSGSLHLMKRLDSFYEIGPQKGQNWIMELNGNHEQL